MVPNAEQIAYDAQWYLIPKNNVAGHLPKSHHRCPRERRHLTILGKRVGFLSVHRRGNYPFQRALNALSRLMSTRGRFPGFERRDLEVLEDKLERLS